MNEIEFNIKALQSIKTTGLKIKWQRPTLPLLRSTIAIPNRKVKPCNANGTA